MIIEYRKKRAFRNKLEDGIWRRCTAEERDRIEKIARGRFEFVEKAAPTPTPAMLAAEQDEKATKKKRSNKKESE